MSLKRVVILGRESKFSRAFLKALKQLEVEIEFQWESTEDLAAALLSKEVAVILVFTAKLPDAILFRFYKLMELDLTRKLDLHLYHVYISGELPVMLRILVNMQLEKGWIPAQQRIILALKQNT
jgi:hypothetical protein